MPRLGFLHTAQVHVATFEALVRAVDVGSTAGHLVDPDLLTRARTEGPTADVEAATLQLLRRLVDEGADVVVCTCSTLGPVAESVGADLPVPVLRVDRPMAREAVRGGARVAVVAALESTLGPTRELLADEARRAGVSPTLVEVVVPEAWAAFERGDTDDYLRRVAVAARAVVDRADVVVLAQASMAGAAEGLADLPITVLASPLLAVRHAVAAAYGAEPVGDSA
ncbi:aspartate/glutamate racemase family protein [Nocardioides campestrisoli]|uniref:aspartate/glutamate racemase family protein n=1 Tax=Nocardioides campestrisoli TaxID=2736757 RepID=UPI00163D6842|nr:aspartate/glutamate racemase family protein [Nocardioides campestrisoli]